MLILTTKSFDLEKLTISNPEKYNDVMYCELSNDDSPLYVQTPKLNFRESSDGIRVFFKNEKNTDSVDTFYGMVRDIEESICEKLSEKSIDWFSTEINLDDIRDSLFNTAIKLPTRISEPFSMIVDVPVLPNGEKDIEIFDSSKNSKSYSDLFSKYVSESTFLLQAKDIKITSNQATISWEVVQVLIHKKKNKIKGFGIRIENEEFTEKLKIGVIETVADTQDEIVTPEEPSVETREHQEDSVEIGESHDESVVDLEDTRDECDTIEE